MRPLLVFPSPAPPELAQALDIGGIPWRAVQSVADARRIQPEGGWGGAIVVAAQQPDGAWAMCRALRKGGDTISPLLLLISGRQLDDLEHRDELYDEFCLWPFHPRELERRISHAQWRAGVGDKRSEVIEYESLILNVETYQASIDGNALDLTYMEYELLKFLASSPGRVFTREVLLSRVWGYDYFGGARTVDVHVRRLRAKLGEDRASLIQTVRSVGYSFGR